MVVEWAFQWLEVFTVGACDRDFLFARRKARSVLRKGRGASFPALRSKQTPPGSGLVVQGLG